MKLVYITTDEERYISELLDHDVFVITNNINSPVICFCKRNGLGCEVIDNNDFSNRREHDATIMEKLDKMEVDLVILGGYKRLIKNKEFLDKYGKKMINVHNSFLPNFPGSKPHVNAFFAGVKKSGYTIHFVDEIMDRGEIIFQEEVFIENCKSAQEVYDKLILKGCVGLLNVVERFAEKILKPPISKLF